MFHNTPSGSGSPENFAINPSDKNKNPFPGLTPSSQEEVTSAKAVAGEGRDAKSPLSVFVRSRLSELLSCSMQLPSCFCCNPQLGSDEKIYGKGRVTNGMGQAGHAWFCFCQLSLTSLPGTQKLKQHELPCQSQPTLKSISKMGKNVSVQKKKPGMNNVYPVKKMQQKIQIQPGRRH